MLTFLIQFPIILYRQIDYGLHLILLERIIDSILIVFIVIEIFIGFFAIRNIVKQKIISYKISKSNQMNSENEFLKSVSCVTEKECDGKVLKRH